MSGIDRPPKIFGVIEGLGRFHVSVEYMWNSDEPTAGTDTEDGKIAHPLLSSPEFSLSSIYKDEYRSKSVHKCLNSNSIPYQKFFDCLRQMTIKPLDPGKER